MAASPRTTGSPGGYLLVRHQDDEPTQIIDHGIG